MFTLSSPAFADHQPIPRIHTADGRNLSPPLQWSGAPAEARSFVLIIEDPDAPDPAAPQRTWVHWVLYDIPADARGLAQDAARHGLPAGTQQGLNDWRQSGYGGPSPPVGRHRYFHRLYALDTALPPLHSPTAARVRAAMRGHVLAEATLVGTYASA